MKNYTNDFKGFLDWKCTNCGKMFHQQFDCDIPECPECINKAWEKVRKSKPLDRDKPPIILE